MPTNDPDMVARRARDRSATAVIAYALCTPAIALMLALLLGPALSVVFIALTDWQFGAPTFRFIGLQNFVTLLGDAGVLTSLKNTCFYAVIVVPATTALGLVIALLIEAAPRARAFYRAVHFLPVM